MKLSISRSELQKGLARIQSIVEKRNTMPILANVLLEATTERGAASGTLAMMATDLEVGIRGSHPADVKKAGSVTVSAKKLFEIVRELQDEIVHIEAASNAFLKLRCARSDFNLAGSAAEEYPTLPSAAPERMARAQAALLSEMIERTMYATSADETRYNLNGVYLEAQSDTGKLRMVATDGHRLAYVDRVLGSELEGLSPGVIVPKKGLAELKRLVDEEDADEIEIGFEGNSGLVRKGDVTLVMRLIEGEFPNYRQVIPKEAGQSLVLTTETLRHAIRRVALLSAERSRAIKLELGDNLLRLSSTNPDLGEAHEELDVDYRGEAISMAFNARYLMDSLAVVHAKEIRLSFRDALSAVQLVPTDDPDTLAVVMPMRL
jgi:DNA polymerase-3 subunit beta